VLTRRPLLAKRPRGEARLTSLGGSSHRAETASNTLRDLRVAEVVKQDVQINDGGTVTYRIKLQVSFKYEADGTD